MLIVFDGAVDIPDDLAGDPSLRRVPGEVWEDDRPMGTDPDNFWAELRRGRYPSTSPPSVDALAAAYEHQDTVIAVHVSGQLSATVQRAEEAAARGGGAVVVVDSKSLSVGAGLIVVAVHRFAQQASGAPVVDFARSLPARLHTFAVVQEVESLRRSDRSGLLPKSHLAGNHPLLLSVRGRVVALSQPKHRSAVIDDLAGHVKRSAGAQPAAWALGHGDAKDAGEVIGRLSKAFGNPPRFVSRLDPTVGAHLGPDSLVVGALSGPVEL